MDVIFVPEPYSVYGLLFQLTYMKRIELFTIYPQNVYFLQFFIYS